MKANPRQLTRRQGQWLSHLRRAEARKMPLAQYCRAQGLSVQNLYNARYQLTQEGQQSRTRQPAPKKLGSASAFVAVQRAPGPAIPAVVCRVQLQGVVIECASLPPPAWLTGLARGATDAVP